MPYCPVFNLGKQLISAFTMGLINKSQSALQRELVSYCHFAAEGETEAQWRRKCLSVYSSGSARLEIKPALLRLYPILSRGS